MGFLEAVNGHTGKDSGDQHTERSIAELVASIYEAAPMAARVRLLDYLLRPLGALSILVVADGVFGKIWFRHGWCEFRIRPEDIQDVQPVHVVALVEHVLQRRAHTIYELPEMLGASANPPRSTAIERLWALLGRRPPDSLGQHSVRPLVRAQSEFPGKRTVSH
jgi:hypothetical protein